MIFLKMQEIITIPAIGETLNFGDMVIIREVTGVLHMCSGALSMHMI